MPRRRHRHQPADDVRDTENAQVHHAHHGVDDGQHEVEKHAQHVELSKHQEPKEEVEEGGSDKTGDEKERDGETKNEAAEGDGDEDEDEDEDAARDGGGHDTNRAVAPAKSATKPLTNTQRGTETDTAHLSTPRVRKSGVIYLSRLPPGIDVTALRQLLSSTGIISRLWLRPDSSNNHFRDGWVQYVRRKDAKRTVEMLNATPMRGKKRAGRWSDDLWSMKYLRGFAWADLKREVFGVKRERELRVREEVMMARREKNWVEQRSGLKRKLERNEDGKRRVREFKQRRVRDEEEERAKVVEQRMESGVQKGVDKELVGMLFGN